MSSKPSEAEIAEWRNKVQELENQLAAKKDKNKELQDQLVNYQQILKGKNKINLLTSIERDALKSELSSLLEKSKQGNSQANLQVIAEQDQLRSELERQTKLNVNLEEELAKLKKTSLERDQLRKDMDQLEFKTNLVNNKNKELAKDNMKKDKIIEELAMDVERLRQLQEKDSANLVNDKVQADELVEKLRKENEAMHTRMNQLRDDVEVKMNVILI